MKLRSAADCGPFGTESHVERLLVAPDVDRAFADAARTLRTLAGELYARGHAREQSAVGASSDAILAAAHLEKLASEADALRGQLREAAARWGET